MIGCSVQMKLLGHIALSGAGKRKITVKEMLLEVQNKRQTHFTKFPEVQNKRRTHFTKLPEVQNKRRTHFTKLLEV